MNREALERLIKIRNLMLNAATTGEAEAAAIAFNRMLVKENLTEAEIDLEMTRTTSRKSKIVSREIIVSKPKTPGIGWRITLLGVIARANFCEQLVPETGGWHRCWIVGRPENVDAVGAFYMAAVEVFERLEAIAWKNLSDFNRPFRSSWRSSYMLGACNGLHDCLVAEAAKNAQDEQISALVLVREGEVTEFLEKLGVKMNTSSGSGYDESDQRAFIEGYKDGRSYATPRIES